MQRSLQIFQKNSRFAACEMREQHFCAELPVCIRACVNILAMNQTKIAPYLSPEVMVFEVKTEGVICNSGRVQDYNWNQYVEE